MDERTELFLDSFIQNIKDTLDYEIVMGYDFDDNSKSYKIWHTYVRFDDIEFKKILGKAIRDILYENEIFNFYISYDNRDDGEYIVVTRTHQSQYSFGTFLWENQISASQIHYAVNNDANAVYVNKDFERCLEQTDVVLEQEIMSFSTYLGRDNAA